MTVKMANNGVRRDAETEAADFRGSGSATQK